MKMNILSLFPRFQNQLGIQLNIGTLLQWIQLEYSYFLSQLFKAEQTPETDLLCLEEPVILKLDQLGLQREVTVDQESFSTSVVQGLE